MRARILPVEEWHKLDDPSLPPLWGGLLPQESDVVVVEDEEGKIIARMLVMRITHLEGVWIDPEHKAVASRLLRESAKATFRWADKWCLGGADSLQMREIMNRLGGKKWPGEFYILGTGG
jgi:hypothetical protein